MILPFLLKSLKFLYITCKSNKQLFFYFTYNFLPLRYFKQIAKSVRANGSASSSSEENVDDFLGCINIPLNVSIRCKTSTYNKFKEIVRFFSVLPLINQQILERFLSQEIPVAGSDTWFKLEPRSSASKVQGECHLILKVFTSQVCTASFPLLFIFAKTYTYFIFCFVIRETQLCLRGIQTCRFIRNCSVGLWSLNMAA